MFKKYSRYEGGRPCSSKKIKSAKCFRNKSLKMVDNFSRKCSIWRRNKAKKNQIIGWAAKESFRNLFLIREKLEFLLKELEFLNGFVSLCLVCLGKIFFSKNGSMKLKFWTSEFHRNIRLSISSNSTNSGFYMEVAWFWS